MEGQGEPTPVNLEFYTQQKYSKMKAKEDIFQKQKKKNQTERMYHQQDLTKRNTKDSSSSRRKLTPKTMLETYRKEGQ